MLRVESVLVHNAKGDARFPARLDQRVSILERKRHRLLHQHMLPRTGSGDALFGVQAAGRADGHHIDVRTP
jgi:hypothetical protein